jgi:hypothetical protein
MTVLPAPDVAAAGPGLACLMVWPSVWTPR